jgi:hypothetical protein
MKALIPLLLTSTLIGSFLGSFVSGGLQLIADWRKRVHETRQHDDRVRKEAYESYLRVIVNLPSAWWESVVAGNFDAIDGLTRARDEVRVKLLVTSQAPLRDGIQRMEQNIPKFIARWHELSHRDMEKERDERDGVPITMRRAFDEVMWPALQELSSCLNGAA